MKRLTIHLEDDHKEHCLRLGLPDAPHRLDVDEQEYFRARDMWRETLSQFGKVDEEVLHRKAIGLLATTAHHGRQREKQAPERNWLSKAWEKVINFEL